MVKLLGLLKEICICTHHTYITQISNTSISSTTELGAPNVSDISHTCRLSSLMEQHIGVISLRHQVITLDACTGPAVSTPIHFPYVWLRDARRPWRPHRYALMVWQGQTPGKIIMALQLRHVSAVMSRFNYSWTGSSTTSQSSNKWNIKVSHYWSREKQTRWWLIVSFTKGSKCGKWSLLWCHHGKGKGLVHAWS